MERRWLKFPKQNIKVWVANNDEDRKNGLSFIPSIEQDEGMLFVFDQDDFHGVWMKGMEFPLDIIWFDRNLQVVDYKFDVQPCSGWWFNVCETHLPKKKARYVLEVNSGVGSKIVSK